MHYYYLDSINSSNNKLNLKNFNDCVYLFSWIFFRTKPGWGDLMEDEEEMGKI